MAEPRRPVAGVFPGDIPCVGDCLVMEESASGTDTVEEWANHIRGALASKLLISREFFVG